MIASVVLDVTASLPGLWKDLRGAAHRTLGLSSLRSSPATFVEQDCKPQGPPWQVDDVSELGQAEETQDVAGP